MLALFSQFRAPIIIWCTVTLFFAFQFILRLSAGILREEIIQKFSISTTDFGTLAGYYYLGYAGMQIPLGYLLDKYNFRYVTATAIIIAALGTLTFTVTDKWELVLFGRFLIGAGSAVGFLAVTKVIKSYFPENLHSILIGFAFTIGLTGAIIGGKPTKIWFDQYGYDATFHGLIIIALLLAGLILLVRDDKVTNIPDSAEDLNQLSFIQAIKLISNPTILLIAVSGGLMVGSLEGFADVWAIPFFNQIYGYSEYDSIFAISIVYIGMCVGGPLLVWLSEIFKLNMLFIFIVACLMSILFITLFYPNHITYNHIVGLMFCLGILCCYQVLIFSLITQIVDKSCAGFVTAVINCINMSFGHFFHVIISVLMQNNWDLAVNDKGLPLYSLDTYIVALSPIPICCLIGAIGFLYLTLNKTRSNIKIVI